MSSLIAHTEATTEAVAEAFARTPLPNIGVCTELYGFPNEVLQKSSGVVGAYMNCLMEPIEAVGEDVKICNVADCNARVDANPERFSRWFLIERKRRRRRWSTGNA
jgi:hypothetical protein